MASLIGAFAAAALLALAACQGVHPGTFTEPGFSAYCAQHSGVGVCP